MITGENVRMAWEEDLRPTTTLARTLGLRDLVLLTIGTVIGSGIFIVPSTVLAQVKGAVAVAMLVWIVGGVLCSAIRSHTSR